ncbi:MAG: hypothetical protein ACRCTI_03950 [Beijerinckiaceae bacterium]
MRADGRDGGRAGSQASLMPRTSSASRGANSRGVGSVWTSQDTGGSAGFKDARFPQNRRGSEQPELDPAVSCADPRRFRLPHAPPLAVASRSLSPTSTVPCRTSRPVQDEEENDHVHHHPKKHFAEQQIAELRAELAHCDLTKRERREAVAELEWLKEQLRIDDELANFAAIEREAEAMPHAARFNLDQLPF